MTGKTQLIILILMVIIALAAAFWFDLRPRFFGGEEEENVSVTGICQRVESEPLDFGYLKKVYNHIKNESVFIEDPDAETFDTELFVNGAVVSMFEYLGEPEIPDWAQDIIDTYREENGSLDFQVLNRIYAELIKDPIYDDYEDSDQRVLLFAAAAEGLIKAIGDPYAVYYTPEDVHFERTDHSGTYSGIGTQVDKNEKGEIVITEVFSDSPAEKAGIRDGDVLLAVNGESVERCSVGALVMVIRGRSGTDVTLTVRHLDQTVEDITITRGKVVTKHVFSCPGVVLPERGRTDDDMKLPQGCPLKNKEGEAVNDILYIKIEEFADDVANDVKAILKGLDLSEFDGIILDLRGNPGGGLGATVDIASFFLPADSVVFKIQDRNGVVQAVLSEKDQIINTEIPIAVLVGRDLADPKRGRSASASEILSAALRDNGRAILIGDRTEGKSTGNGTFFINGGDYGALYLAVWYWLTPNGENIGGQDLDGDRHNDIGGMEPDIKVMPTDEDYSRRGHDFWWDVQMFAAIEYLQSLNP